MEQSLTLGYFDRSEFEQKRFTERETLNWAQIQRFFERFLVNEKVDLDVEQRFSVVQLGNSQFLHVDGSGLDSKSTAFVLALVKEIRCDVFSSGWHHDSLQTAEQFLRKYHVEVETRMMRRTKLYP